MDYGHFTLAEGDGLTKLTIFILLAHVAIFVVNYLSMQVNPQMFFLPS